MQKILEWPQFNKYALAQGIWQPCPFEMRLYFYELMILDEWMQKKLFSTLCCDNKYMGVVLVRGDGLESMHVGG